MYLPFHIFHAGLLADGFEMVLFEDGLEVAQTLCGDTANPAGDSFSIGFDLSNDFTIDATIDELRISDVPRLGDNLTRRRILVADSGNNRLQAFNSQGDFLSEFGTYSDGEGQFDDPQGLVVNPNRNVFVVEWGNNRLVVLRFDGQVFSHIGSFYADSNTPTSVAVSYSGDLVVADTGIHPSTRSTGQSAG